MASASRAAALTHRLLAFARRQPLDPKPTDVNYLVAGMSDLLRRTIGRSTSPSSPGLGGRPVGVEADPHQLENALLNLAINARDAMPERRHPRPSRTSNGALGEGRAPAGRDPARHVRVPACLRHRGRHAARGDLARASRPVLHHQGARPGHRPGPVDGLRFRPAVRGHVRIESEARPGDVGQPLPPPLTGEAAADAPAETLRHNDGAERRDHPRRGGRRRRARAYLRGARRTRLCVQGGVGRSPA